MSGFTLRCQEDLDLLIQNLTVCVFFIILILKLLSFILVNKKYRVVNPVDPSIHKLARFMFSPTLVYQPHQMPSNGHMSVLYVLKKITEVFVLQAFVRQGAVLMPIVVEELIEAADEEDLILVLER